MALECSGDHWRFSQVSISPTFQKVLVFSGAGTRSTVGSIEQQKMNIMLLLL